MKKYIVILILLYAGNGFSQSTPVKWELSSRKLDDQSYDLIIKAIIQKGWNIYSEKDEKNDLEGVKVEWDNENIVRDGELQVLTAPVIYNDPIFRKNLKVYQGQLILQQHVKIPREVPFSFMLGVKAFGSSKTEFLPFTETKEIQLEGGTASIQNIKLSGVDLNNPAAPCGDEQKTKGKGLLTIFLLGIAGGLFALLTPCVFPMIPVTVSFFTNRSATKKQGVRNGILYGTFILLIYGLVSIPFHLIGNISPQILNTISTNAWVNIAFFAIFIYFALSFFGLYEIGLPAGFANKANSKSNLGSTGGIFFMALTLAIVSFSCTGPILGMLLVGSLHGGAWLLTAGLAGFGVALALPFGLFAMFPQWLQKLPRSGGWMSTVKKTLAFVELALALKFLSNADLVEHWGILKREVFIGAWILISIGLALYLFGAFNSKKLSSLHVAGNKIKRKNYGRIAFGVVAGLFALYLIPGLTQTKSANLKLLSGFAPPLSYSIYGKANLHGKGLEPDVINDYEKAIALSKQTHKPLLIDFTGWACVNCRKMEEQVWTKSSIHQLIKDNYVLVSLYVDDRKKLADGKTVGDKWAAFQSDNFQQVTQPLYVVLSPDERLMIHPVGYTPEEDTYADWLKCGISAFKNSKPLVQK